MFEYKTRVAFYETDAMGVLHHSNYVRLAERARVEWLREAGVMATHIPNGEDVFAVVDLQMQFKRPVRFDEVVTVRLAARVEGVRLHIEYTFFADEPKVRNDVSAQHLTMICKGSTTLVNVENKSLKPKRLPKSVVTAVERLASLSVQG